MRKIIDLANFVKRFFIINSWKNNSMKEKGFYLFDNIKVID